MAPERSTDHPMVPNHAPPVLTGRAASRLRTRAVFAAALSAAMCVLYGLLLRSIPDLRPPDPDADPAVIAGFRLLFVVLGVLLAVLFAWRYLSVARAAGAGNLELRHRRRLRTARTVAVWSVVALSMISAGFASLQPAALPLAAVCVVAAVGWAVAAVSAVRAERAEAEDHAQGSNSGGSSRL